ncbi:MAG: hypothetical protein E4H00_06160 [Myxococcales bacterium]|nr:MAG: hypothetical protein E4H00_06160 [Myxococcales bacterium]
MNTSAKHIRIKDDLWNAAASLAALNGTTVSHVVRVALTKYVEADGREYVLISKSDLEAFLQGTALPLRGAADGMEKS